MQSIFSNIFVFQRNGRGVIDKGFLLFVNGNNLSSAIHKLSIQGLTTALGPRSC